MLRPSQPTLTKDQLLQTAQAHLRAERFSKARALYEKLRDAAPARAEAHIYLSRLAYEQGDRDTCLTELATALEKDPDNARLWQHAADRYRHFDAQDLALRAFDAAIALDPKSIAPRAERALYLQTLGRFEAASKAYRKLLKGAPRDGQLYRMALPSLNLKPADPLRRQMARLWSDKTLPDQGRLHLGFALAQAEQDPKRMFGFLDRANALQKAAHPFDRAAHAEEYRAVLAAQDGDLTPVGETDAPRMVFVTGMPRSGTTLVEQILAAHSEVTAGGEMAHALSLAYKHFGHAAAMTRGDDTAIQRFAARYHALVQRDCGQAHPVVTDKAIMSHLIMGLLHRALPGVRFVVVQRDPRDIALSIYRNHFALGTHAYSCDLADIAFVIKAFRRNIAHWKQRLPGVIHEVRYEDLVSDPEPQARALVAAAGLDWQDQCLSFHEKKGAVQTLSLAQVRQPIHAGRREAWRRYEAQLQPFIDAWGDEPWD
ncbi:MAG: sulfotransferase [Pelagimonas sp.]|jgi:tetratricopeptide (TPR) repeat protein|nr:sulfotransferase [Pelagimonas sp.]